MRLFFDYVENRNKLDVAYFNCPTECVESPKYYDRTRRDLCIGCPRKQIEENFKSEAEQLMSDWLGLKAEKFRFNEIKSAIFSVRDLSELSKTEMTVKTAGLLTVYRIEESRHKAVKESEK